MFKGRGCHKQRAGRVVREGSSEKVTFEQRCEKVKEQPPRGYLREEHSFLCKGPEVGPGLAGLR